MVDSELLLAIVKAADAFRDEVDLALMGIECRWRCTASSQKSAFGYARLKLGINPSP